MIPDAPEPYILSDRQLATLSLCYRMATLENSETIRVLQSLHAVHPELVTVRTPHDADLYERVEACATALGRSLVNAYLTGQCGAYRQTGGWLKDQIVISLETILRWDPAAQDES